MIHDLAKTEHNEVLRSICGVKEEDMKLHALTPANNSTKKRTRIGRGTGSGLGKTSGRGQKGQNSRSGGGVRPGFEGGQMPLARRLPKRGFINKFRKEFLIINVGALNSLQSGTTVNAELLIEKGLIKFFTDNAGLKVLGNGTLSKKLTVQAKKFTNAAKEAIEKAGGKAEVI